jgi:hypothetical protein
LVKKSSVQLAPVAPLLHHTAAERALAPPGSAWLGRGWIADSVWRRDIEDDDVINIMSLSGCGHLNRLQRHFGTL